MQIMIDLKQTFKNHYELLSKKGQPAITMVSDSEGMKALYTYPDNTEVLIKLF